MSLIGAAALAGGLSLGSNIVGGLMASHAQNKVNKTNLQIARETNQANLDIMHENNNLARQMWEHELWYNSPSAQRAMMEQAGYNPFSLYSNGQGSASSAPGLPSLQQSKMYAPTMIPEDAAGRQMAQVGNDMANMVVALSQARKNDSETNVNNVRLQTLGETLAAQLEGMGLSNKAQTIRNYVAEGTKEFDIERASKDVDYLSNMIGLTAAQTAQVHMINELTEEFGPKFVDAQVNKLIAEAFKLNEEGKTEASKRKLNEALAGRADTESWFQRFIAPYQANELSARASEERSQSLNLDEARKYIGIYAGNDVARVWNDCLNGRASRGVMEQNKRLLGEAIKKAIVDNDWNAIEHLIGAAQKIGDIMDSLTPAPGKMK